MDLLGYPLIFLATGIYYSNKFLYRRYFNAPYVSNMFTKLHKDYQKISGRDILPFKQTRRLSTVVFLFETIGMRIVEAKVRIRNTSNNSLKMKKIFINFDKLQDETEQYYTSLCQSWGLRFTDIESLSRYFKFNHFKKSHRLQIFEYLRTEDALELYYKEELNDKMIMQSFTHGGMDFETLKDSLIFLYSPDTKTIFMVENPHLEQNPLLGYFSEIFKNEIPGIDYIKSEVQFPDLENWNQMNSSLKVFKKLI